MYLSYGLSIMLIQVGNAGSVELLDTFGDDLTVVNAARVSFNKESSQINPKDAGLIKYLATHEHTSPFFHPQLRFRLKMPIFVAREWFRHTIGFARNEVSRRYVDDKPEIWIPGTFRERDQNLKQGSKATEVSNSDAVRNLYMATTDASLKAYEAMLESGVAPEIARSILPQGMYTEFIETGSLAAYARLCNLRLDPHAQVEIREFAGAVAEFISTKFPISWSTLCKS